MGGIAALRKRLQAARVVQLPTVFVGWPEDGPGGKEVARIAQILMAGSRDGRIPARPVLDRVALERRGAIQRASTAAVAALVRGQPAAARSILEALASDLEGWVREALEDGAAPPNAASTIARKGFDYPLRNPGGEDRLFRYLVSGVRD